MSIFESTPDGKLLARGEEIANFAPQIDYIYWDAGAHMGGFGPPRAIRVSFVIAGQSQPYSATIDCREIDSFNFEVEFPGCICMDSKGNSTRKRIAQFLREQLTSVPAPDSKGIFFPLSGWYDLPTGRIFIAGDEVLGATTEQPVAVLPSVSSIQLVCDSARTPCGCTEDLLRIFKIAPDVYLPVFAFTLFASLRSVFSEEKLPTACVLYIEGNQGFGKTKTAKRFCLLYRNNEHEWVHAYDARSTEAAMEDALASARDQIVLFDDVCKSTNKQSQRKRRDLAANLARAAANEIPITKMRGRTAETVECVASLVITGEFPLETASDLTRCVIVNIERQLTGGSDSDRVVAASVLAGFLQWFAEHSEQELDRLRKEFESFKTKERSHREERLQISLWELSWVFSSFLRFAFSISAIGENAARQIDAALTHRLQQIFVQTLQKVDKLNALDSLGPLIFSGAKAQKFPCFQHNGCLCVRSENMTLYLKQMLGLPVLSVKDATALLRSKGLLWTDKSGKATRKIKGVRYLTIPIEILKSKGGASS